MDVVASLSPVSSLLSDEEDAFSVRNEGAGGTPFARRPRSARTSGSSLRFSPDGRSQRDELHDGLSPLTLSPSKTAASSRRHSGRFGWSTSPQVSPGWSLRPGQGPMPVVSPLTLSPSSCPPTAPLSRRMSRGTAGVLSPLSLSPRSAAARSLGTTRRHSRTGTSDLDSPRSGRPSRRVSFTPGMAEISEATPTKSGRGSRSFQSRRGVVQDRPYDEPLTKQDVEFRRFCYLRSELQVADATLRRTRGKLSQMAELCASLQSENDWLTSERAHYVEHALSNSVSMSAVEADATDAVDDDRKDEENKENEDGNTQQDQQQGQEQKQQQQQQKGSNDQSKHREREVGDFAENEDNKDLELEVANLSAQILDLQTQYQELQRDFALAQEQKQTAHSEAAELQSQLSQEREARRRRASEASGSVRELESRLEIANCALAAERQHSEELQKRLEAELVSLTDVTRRLSQMESRDDSQEEKVKAMSRDLERLTRALHEERKKSEEFSRQNLAAEARAQELEAELAHYWSAALVPAASPFAVRMASTRTSSAAPSPDFFPTPPPDVAGSGAATFQLLNGLEEEGELAAGAAARQEAQPPVTTATTTTTAATAASAPAPAEGKAIFSPLQTATPLPRFFLPSPSFGEQSPEQVEGGTNKEEQKLERTDGEEEARNYQARLALESARVEELQQQLAASEGALAQLRIQLAASPSEDVASPLASAVAADDVQLSEVKLKPELYALPQEGAGKTEAKEPATSTGAPPGGHQDTSRSAKLSSSSLKLLRQLAPLVLWSAIQSVLSLAWTCAFPESPDFQEAPRRAPRSFELLPSGSYPDSEETNFPRAELPLPGVSLELSESVDQSSSDSYSKGEGRSKGKSKSDSKIDSSSKKDSRSNSKSNSKHSSSSSLDSEFHDVSDADSDEEKTDFATRNGEKTWSELNEGLDESPPSRPTSPMLNPASVLAFSMTGVIVSLKFL